jgi:hypothetical protein
LDVFPVKRKRKQKDIRLIPTKKMFLLELVACGTKILNDIDIGLTQLAEDEDEGDCVCSDDEENYGETGTVKSIT